MCICRRRPGLVHGFERLAFSSKAVGPVLVLRPDDADARIAGDAAGAASEEENQRPEGKATAEAKGRGKVKSKGGTSVRHRVSGGRFAFKGFMSEEERAGLYRQTGGYGTSDQTTHARTYARAHARARVHVVSTGIKKCSDAEAIVLTRDTLGPRQNVPPPATYTPIHHARARAPASLACLPCCCCYHCLVRRQRTLGLSLLPCLRPWAKARGALTRALSSLPIVPSPSHSAPLPPAHRPDLHAALSPVRARGDATRWTARDQQAERPHQTGEETAVGAAGGSAVVS